MGWCANELVVVQAPLACVRGGQGREGLGRTPEGTPPVMGREEVKGPLEEETSELRQEREERASCAKSRCTDSTNDLGSVWRNLRCRTPGWVETRCRPAKLSRSGRGPVDESRARWAQILPEAMQSGLQSDSPWGFIRGRSSVHISLVPKKFVFIVTSA